MCKKIIQCHNSFKNAPNCVGFFCVFSHPLLIDLVRFVAPQANALFPQCAQDIANGDYASAFYDCNNVFGQVLQCAGNINCEPLMLHLFCCSFLRFLRRFVSFLFSYAVY